MSYEGTFASDGTVSRETTEARLRSWRIERLIDKLIIIAAASGLTLALVDTAPTITNVRVWDDFGSVSLIPVALPRRREATHPRDAGRLDRPRWPEPPPARPRRLFGMRTSWP